MSNESQLLIASDSGTQIVIPQLAVASPQVIYLDFNGAETSYDNRDLDIFIDNIMVDDSGFDAKDITYIVDTLNAQFDDDIVFTAELPETDEYSTIYIGVTSAFDVYGEFLGLAETIDSGNQIHDDNAFVFLNSTASLELVTSVIAHETEHIVYGYEHGGEDLQRFAEGISVSSGQVISGNIISSGTTVYVSSGGTLNSTIVNSGGRLYVSNGGMVNDMSINSGGGGYVSIGGIVNSTTVNGGYLEVGIGGTVNSTTINSDGRLWVYSGGKALNIVADGGEIYIGSGATATFVPHIISSRTVSGLLRVYSGTTVNSATVNSGYLYVFSGGIVNSTIVNGGGVYVSSGGTASSVALNSSGHLSVSSGGTAVGISAEEGAMLDLEVAPNTYIQGESNGSAFEIADGIASSLVVDSGTLYVGSGGTATNITVNSAGTVDVGSGGTATNIIVNSDGWLDFSSGGTATGILVEEGGILHLNITRETYFQGISAGSAFEMKDAYISGFTITNNGMMEIYWGGRADSTVNLAGGMMVGYDGVVNHTIIESEGWMEVWGYANSTTINFGGWVEIYENLADNTTVNSDGTLMVAGEGIAKGTVVNSGGGLEVFNNGVVSGTTINGGWMCVNSYGGETATAVETIVNADGELIVFAGGTAESTVINSDGGLIVFSDGVANDTIVTFGGMFFVSSGGIANIVDVNSDGWLAVFSGGTAIGLSVEAGGELILDVAPDTYIQGNANGSVIEISNGIAEYMAVEAKWVLHVSSGGLVVGVTVSSGGELRVSANGSLNDGIVESGGYLVVNSGAAVSALTLLSGGYAELNDGVTVSGLILDAGASVDNLSNTGSSAIVLDSYLDGVVSGKLENVSLGGVLSIATGTELKNISGNFTLKINDLAGNYTIAGNDFSQMMLDLTGDGVIDLSGNYWGTTNIDAIYARLGVDSSTVRIDDVLGRNPNATAFVLESTNLTKNYLAPGQTTVSFIFNSLLDAETVSTDAITFVSTTGKSVAVRNTIVHDNVLTVAFDELTSEGVYTIRFADTIHDVDGNALTSIRNARLMPGIGEQLRITARLSGASVVKVAPAGDIAGTLTTFRVYFSKSVDPTTLLDNVKLIAPNDTAIAPTSVRMLNDSTVEFTVPPQTAVGKYSVQISAKVADYAGVLLDQNGNGIDGEANDGFVSTFALTEIDLAIKDVQVQNKLTSGEVVTVMWKVANESGTALMGSWTDGVYLSTDARWDIGDTLLTTYTYVNGIAAGEILSGEASLSLLGVKEGSYYLLVRSDIHNDEEDGVADAVAAQNLVATPITVQVPQLTVGEIVTGSFAASGDFATYRVRQQADEALRFELDSHVDAANVELYVGYDYAPTREQYDAKLQRITDAMMTIDSDVVSRDVYVMVYAKSTTAAFDYTLSARKAPTAIDKIMQSSQDGSESITLTITGKNFTNGMIVRLVASDGTAIVLEDVRLLGSTRLIATIAAEMLATGDYTLELVDGDDTIVGNQLVLIRAVAGEGKLEHSFYAPATVGRHAKHTLYLSVSNTGTAAIDAPLVFFTPTQSHANGTETMGAILSFDYDQSAFWISTVPAGYSDSLSFFVNGEVFGTIQPGENLTIPIHYIGWRNDDWDFGESHIHWNVSVLYANDNTPLKWSEVFQNCTLSLNTKQTLEQLFSTEFGATWGGYCTMVVGNLHYLEDNGFSTSTVDSISMLRFETMQKTGLLQPFRNLAEVEAWELAENSITIQCSYDIGQGRVEEGGSFGYGWTFNWDVRLATTQNGDIQIVQGNTRRLYQPTASFSYQSVLKDGSSLKNNAMGYRLTDTDGSQWQFDTDGRLLYVIQATGQRLFCIYNVNNQLERLENAKTGSYVSFVRDDETGLITEIKDNTGKRISYVYSEDGDLISINDSEKGLVATYEYFATTEHALTKVTDGHGVITAYAYDELGRIMSLTNAASKTTLSYGTAGEVTLVNGDAQVTLYYVSNGNIGKITDDISGKVYTYTYDDNGVFVSGRDSDGNDLTAQFTFAGQEFDVCYNGVDFSNLTFDAVYNTNINTNYYMVEDNAYYKTDQEGNIFRSNDMLTEYYVASYDHDAEDDIISYEYKKNGVTTTYMFNVDGSVSISEDDPSQYFVIDGIKYYRKDMEGNVLGQYDTDVDSYTMGFDAEGNRVFYAYTRDGEATSYQYDLNGNVISMINTDGMTTYTYDAEGNKMTEATPDGTIYRYDVNGNLTSRIDAEGKMTSYAYDVNGNVISVAAEGKTMLYDYDATGNLIGYTDERGNVYAYTYDMDGRQTSVTVNGKTTSYIYDDNGNYTSVTDANGNSCLYNYNADGMLFQFTDANGNVTTYTYNDANDLTRITYADGTFEAYTYNSEGELTGWTGRAGQTAAYTVDANGNYSDIIYSDGKENSFTYTVDDYLLSANDIAFTYDADGNIIAQSFTDGRSIQYTYNDDGYVAGYIDELGHGVNYIYTVDGVYDVLTDENSGVIVDYDYDANGYLVKSAYGNGTYTTYSYDDFGQVIAIDNYGADGSVASFVHYTYDSEGKRTSMTTIDGTWAYTYDAKGQLTGAVFTDNTGTKTQELAYTYDAMGNRLTSTENGVTTIYTYNELNQIVSANGFEYVYDANGNLLEDEKRIYAWTADNHVASETLKSTGQTWEYGYDALGNRVSSTTNGITTSWTVDSNGNVLAEYVNGAWNRTYYQGNLLTGFIDKDGNEYFYNADSLGTTIRVTGIDGSAVNSYTYDPWGNVLNSTEGIDNDFTFVGGYGLMQNDSGTYFVRARNYDAETGRWTSPDPIGISGGKNLYVLLNNNSVNDIDISGYGSFWERPLAFFEGDNWAITGIALLLVKFGGIIGIPSAFLLLKLQKEKRLVIKTPTGGSTTINVYHEHYIGKGFDVGYRGEAGNYSDTDFFGISDRFYPLTGLFSENTSKKDYQRLDSKEYQDNAIRVAARLEALTANWTYLSFDWIKHNCQDFAKALRARYAKVLPEANASKTISNIIPKNEDIIFSSDGSASVVISLDGSASKDNEGIKKGIQKEVWYKYDAKNKVWVECSSRSEQKCETTVLYGLAVQDNDKCWNEKGSIIITKSGKQINKITNEEVGKDVFYLSTVSVTVASVPLDLIVPYISCDKTSVSINAGESAIFKLNGNVECPNGLHVKNYIWSASSLNSSSINITVKAEQQSDGTVKYKWSDGFVGSSHQITLSVTASNGLTSLAPASIVLSVSSIISAPRDPNNMTVAEGVGEAGYIQSGSKLSYKIEFENDPEFATAPAQWVRVFDTLDGSKFDLDSFVLQEFCIAGNTFVVGDGRDSFNRTVELSILDYKITATISINLVRDEDMEVTQLVAEFMAVDPESGFMLQDLENGLLPVNDAFGSGEGHISYTINALDDLPSGTEITNTAKIYFDFNDPIDTPMTLNTIDSEAPVITLDGDNVTPLQSTKLAARTEAGVDIYWSTDNENWWIYKGELNVTTNGTYYFKATDAVGNVGTAQITFDNIDTETPIIDLTGDTMTPLQKATLTASTEAGLKIYYNTTSADFDGEWMEYTGEIDVVANGTYYFKAIDEAGNTGTNSLTFTNIDTVAPVIELNGDTTNPLQAAKLTASTEDGIDIYWSMDNETWIKYDGELNITTNGTYNFKATDAAGNTGTAEIVFDNIDTTAPVISDIMTDVSVPTNGKVTVTASAIDEANDVELFYSKDGGEFTAYNDGVEFTENGSVVFKAIDAAGNETVSEAFEVTNIDTVKPTISDIAADMTAPTNGKVTVTASAIDEANDVELFYSKDGGEFIAYGNGVEFTENGSVVFKAVDAAGNEMLSEAFAVTNIDTVKPTISDIAADVTAPTNGKVVVTAIASDEVNDVTLFYSKDGGEFAAYDNGVEFTENGSVVFKAVDAAGNETVSEAFEVTNIDTVAPRISGIAADVTAPTNGKVTVTASAIDDTNDVELFYSKDGGEFAAYDNGVEFTENGSVVFKAIDAAGNETVSEAFKVTNIDTIVPIIILTGDTTTPLQQSSIIATTEAGLDILWSTDNVNWMKYEGELDIVTNGTYYFKTTDVAGNVGTAQITFTNIDDGAPVITLTGDTTSPLQKSKLSAMVNDDVDIFWSLDKETWTKYEGELDVIANGTYYFKATDAAGNVGRNSITFTNIDTTAPVITLTGNITTPLQSVTLSANTESGVDIFWSANNEKWAKYDVALDITTNGTYYFKATDAAGNVGTAQIVIANIDTVAPNIKNIIADITTPTNNKVTVMAFADDDANDVSLFYSKDGSEFISYDKGVEFTANGNVVFKAVDAAGNETLSDAFEVSNIDITAPVISDIIADVTIPTNGKVTVTANASDDVNAVTLFYSKDGGEFVEYRDGVEFTSNGNVVFKAVDAAGNETVSEAFEVTNIDKVAPVIELTGDTTSSVQAAKLTARTETGVDIYWSTDNASWTMYEGELDITANGTYYFKATDAAGNTGTAQITFANLDTGAPVITLTGDNINPLQKSTLSAMTNEDVDIYWSMDNETWTKYEGPLDITANGTYYFRATDKAGNTGTNSIIFANIDTVAPTIELLADTATPLQSAKLTAGTEADLDIYWSTDNANWMKYDSELNVTANGAYYFKATDAAGNVGTAQIVFENIDTIAPSVSHLEISSPDESGLVAISIEVNEMLSNLQYSWKNGEWLDVVDETISVAENGSIQFRLTDIAGNVTVTENYVVDAFNILVTAIVTETTGNGATFNWADDDTATWADQYDVVIGTATGNIDLPGVAAEGVELLNAPSGEVVLNVKPSQSGIWTAVDSVAVQNGNETASQYVQAEENGLAEVMFATGSFAWNGNYHAQHVGVGEWNGTGETAELVGKNAISDIFAGSDDASVLLLTDDANGDALFIDDIYSAFPEGLDAQARIAKIDEIRAGAGDDIVDLTSQRFDYVGGGMTVRGGLGDDVIWANNGENTLFGDAGNDRIVGGGGNDVIVGGSGDDSMHGGGGEDIFAFGGVWGNDTVEQLEDGKLTLWFENGSLEKWDASTLTYRDGDNSVRVSGVSAENISLKFGDDGSQQYSKLLEVGAFDEFGSERIFENKNRGMLA